MIFLLVLAQIYIAAGCEDFLYRQSGTFSPPANLTSNETCDWRIHAHEDEKIVLNITELDIQKTPNCTSGYVEVREGLWWNSPLVGRFCGTDQLKPIISTGNQLLVSYGPQGLTHGGFVANYEAICGGVLFVQNAITLRSHQTGLYYPLSRKCFWYVVVPDDRRVRLSFQSFRLEEEQNCLYDYVEVEGRRYCGHVVPQDIISLSNVLPITFVSDFSVQDEGFEAIISTDFDECAAGEHDCEQLCINTAIGYECGCRSGYELQPDGKHCQLACGGTLWGPGGRITTPLYPGAYPRSGNCIWQIVAPPGDLVGLTVFDLDIEESEECQKDKLEIFGSDKIGTFCGSVPPSPILTEANGVRIEFSSDDDDVQTRGFSLGYSIFQNACEAFNGNCHHDCIPTLNGTRSCTCNEGAVLQPNSVDCKKNSCTYEITSLSGTIESLNYPGLYPNNLNCTWNFKTTPGHKIQINFTDFSLESHSTCAYDYVAFYDGNSTLSNRIGILCGAPQKPNVTSNRDEMFMVFRADTSSNSRGFQGNYSSVCGGVWNANTIENYIYSHDTYGLTNYTNNFNCTWTITPKDRYNTLVSIERIDVENISGCRNDYVEIFDGPTSLGKFCGNIPPTQTFSTNNTVTVQFHTDGSIVRRGFKIVYKADREEEP